MEEINNGGALAKTGAGTLTLAGTNTYTGATIVSSGTLALGASDVLPNGSALSIYAATLDAGSFTDTVGTLDPSAAATINLGSGATIAFADSSAIDWTGGSLNITGTFVSGSSVRFGTTSGGLTSTQRGLITINSASGTYSLDANGYLVESAGGYASWASTNAPTGTSGDDFDNDGVSNGVEYVLGGDKDTNDLDKLPTISTTLGGDMVFTFERDQASIDGSTIVEIEVSTDLVTWPDTFNVPDTALANNPGVTVVKDTPADFDTVTLTVEQDPDTTKFARLKVIVTP